MRNVTKKFLAALMVLAMLVTVVPAARAEAATTLSDGTYTVTANLYVPSTYNPVKVWNAYFTSTSNPPKSGLSLNATMVVENGTATIKIPLVSTGLSLLSLGPVISGTLNGVTADADASSYTCGSGRHSFNRISEVEIVAPVSSATGTVQYQFGTSTIHAQINMLGVAVHDGNLSVSGIYLDVEYSSAVAK